MNPNYVHTVTLYLRQSDGSYTRKVVNGCFWKANTTTVQSGTEASVKNTYTVRIPMEKVPEGLAVTLNNDMAILGECLDEVSSTAGYRAAEILNKHKPDAFKVTAFTDNTGHLLDKHYRLGG